MPTSLAQDNAWKREHDATPNDQRDERKALAVAWRTEVKKFLAEAMQTLGGLSDEELTSPLKVLVHRVLRTATLRELVRGAKHEYKPYRELQELDLSGLDLEAMDAAEDEERAKNEPRVVDTTITSEGDAVGDGNAAAEGEEAA
ncbi:unnamed protein product [Chrysoparadoxa australica]